jgi:hypothetical protein
MKHVNPLRPIDLS